MNQQNENEIKRTGHVYDGIEELDHPSPNWFMALFYVTIVFGVFYALYYMVGEGPTLAEEYRRAKDADDYAVYENQIRTGPAKLVSEDELRTLLKNSAIQSKGAASFQAKCTSCHGSQGQGGIGPNLTDSYWLHGAKLTDVFKTISQGVPEKGMPPWGPLLSSDEVQALTIYVRSLAGTRPAGAKAPQGSLVRAE